MKPLPILITLLALTHLGLAEKPAKPTPAKPNTPPKAEAKADAQADSLEEPEAVKPIPGALQISMRDGLRFEPPRIVAEPGKEIVIQIENADTTHISHNFLVLSPGKLKPVVDAAMALGEKGPAQNFIPAGPDVLAHSPVLDPEKTATLKFTLPSEPGIYPYVCTIPGHGMIMYGAIYSGVKPPALAQDTNLPPTVTQGALAGGGARPYVQRMFMPDAGPAAIAVALSGTQNFCWDAGQCRLRYAWQGTFIDASAYWSGNGNALAVLPAAPWWKSSEFPLQFGDGAASAQKVKYLGYKAGKDSPEFHYRVGATEIFEKITASADSKALNLHYRIVAPTQPLNYRAAAAPNVKWTSSVGAFKDGVLSLSASQSADFTLTLAPAQ